MKCFYWEGHDDSGHQQGVIEAISRDDAQLRLYGKGVTPILIRPSAKPDRVRRSSSRKKKLSLPYSLKLTRNLSSLLSAGIPLSQAIEISLKGQQPKQMTDLLKHLQASVDSGETLHRAFSSSPVQLPALTTAIVEAGEAAGKLPHSLDQLSVHLSNELALNTTVRQALRYPLITLIAMLAVLVLMLNWVMPQFASSFTQLGAELPHLTRLILSASAFSQRFILPIAIGTLLFLVLFMMWASGSVHWQKISSVIKLRLPVTGTIHQEGIMMRISSTMALMLKSGISLPQALRLTAPTCLNVCFEEHLLNLADTVESGTSLVEAIRLNGSFPVMIAQLIHIGEESGQLEAMLDRAHELYRQRYQSNIEALTGLLEPILMTLLCAIAGIMMLAVYLPIFQLGSVI